MTTEESERPELDLSQCEDYDEEGVRCHRRGKYCRLFKKFLCQNCAEVLFLPLNEMKP